MSLELTYINPTFTRVSTKCSEFPFFFFTSFSRVFGCGKKGATTSPSSVLRDRQSEPLTSESDLESNDLTREVKVLRK